MKIEFKSFDQLNVYELHDIFKLRTDIFVVEQKCAYPEIDGYDKEAIHALGTANNTLVAYTRLLPPGSVYDQISIGRVATHEDYRKEGYGRKIFESSVNKMREIYPGEEIKIQAQIYLEKFYSSFGFKTISEPYPDVGVWHVDMILPG